MTTWSSQIYFRTRPTGHGGKKDAPQTEQAQTQRAQRLRDLVRRAAAPKGGTSSPDLYGMQYSRYSSICRRPQKVKEYNSERHAENSGESELVACGKAFVLLL